MSVGVMTLMNVVYYEGNKVLKFEGCLLATGLKKGESRRQTMSR
jgi:hypothetical protein